jgi:hypothetical protein
VVDVNQFVSNVEELADSLEQKENLAFSRHGELTDLAGKLKTDYSRADDEVIHILIKALEAEHKEFRELCRRESNSRGKLQTALRLISYFKAYQDPQLLEIKLNLSSPKGLRTFLRKAESHSALLNRKVLGELRKVEGELLAEQKQLDELEGQAIVSKLRQLLRQAGRGEERPASQLKLIHKPSC